MSLEPVCVALLQGQGRDSWADREQDGQVSPGSGD